MPTVSTHVLDGAAGGPCPGVAVELTDASGVVVASSSTGPDGRIPRLGGELPAGTYQLTWRSDGAFLVSLCAKVILDEDRHYHVPLLQSGASAMVYLGV